MKIKVKKRGKNCMILAWVGSPIVMGVIFWVINMVAPMSNVSTGIP